VEDREVLGRIAELAKEEHEQYHKAGKGGLSAREHKLLRQLQVNLGRVLGPPHAAPDAQRGRLRPQRGKGKGRKDRRGLTAVALQPVYGVPGRSGTRRLESVPQPVMWHAESGGRREARSPTGRVAASRGEGS
jgi:hypothetical protein